MEDKAYEKAKKLFQQRSRETKREASAHIRDALRELAKPAGEFENVGAHLVAALLSLGECRGFCNAIYDLENEL